MITEQIAQDLQTSGIRGEKDDTLLLLEHLFKQILKISTETTILDLGCGDGEYHLKLKDYNFIGVDNREDFKNTGNIYLQQDLNRFPYEQITSKYNYIICLDTLEHLYRPDLFLKNIHDNLLTDDGYLFLCVPNTDNVEDRLNNINTAIFDIDLKNQTNNRWTSQHIRFFNFQSLEKLCKNFFKIYAVTGCNFFTTSMGQMICNRFNQIFNIPIEHINRELGNVLPTLAPNIFFILTKKGK